MDTIVLESTSTIARRAVGPASAGNYAARISVRAACVALAASAATLVVLVSLHILSPEFDPAWRMISEYALGQFGWVLSLMFLFWGVSTWALTVAIWRQVHTRAGKVGLWLLVVAGLGEAMASVFDVTHDLEHGISGLLGMGSLPIAALLVSASLDRTPGWATSSRPRRWVAWAPSLSLVLLIATTLLMMLQFIQVNGGTLPQQAPASLPPGVLGLDGWAVRLVVLANCGWQALVAWQAIKLHAGVPVESPLID
jgi:hypothetical protein